MTEESVPQRARRKGKDYAETYHDRWSSDGRKWIKFAFAKGYQAASEDIAAEIDEALSQWEYDRDQDALVEALDAILDCYAPQEAAA